MVVTRTGAIQPGNFGCKAEGQDPEINHDYCDDAFSEADYASGRMLLTVEVEVDVDALFAAHTVPGVVASAVFEGEVA